MSKLNWAGIVCLALGFLLILFQGIASQMGDDQKERWSEVTIEHWTDSEYLEWIDDIGWKHGRKAVDFLIITPIYYILFVLGGIFLIIGSFFWRK